MSIFVQNRKHKKTRSWSKQILKLVKKLVSHNSGLVVGMWWASKMIEHNQNNVKNPLKVPFWNPLISLPSFWYCSTGIINKSFMPCANCKNECIGPTPPKMAGIWFCLMSANQSVTKRVINLSKPKKQNKKYNLDARALAKAMS